jgi:hypothetical protein
MKRTKAFTNDSPPPKANEYGLTDEDLAIDRAAILARIGLKNNVENIEDLTVIAQGLIVDLFVSQAAICLKSQQEFYKGEIFHVAIEQFRVLNICSDMMRELTGYDLTLDPNKAIETLERQGYKVLPGNEILNMNTSEEVNDDAIDENTVGSAESSVD